MLQPDYLSVLESRSSEELRARIVAFGAELGFERVGALSVIERHGEAPRFLPLDNMPEAYVALARDVRRGAADPVVQHCKRSSVPIIWGQSTYTARELGPQWEQQQPFGYANGIAVGLHLPYGRHFVFGVNRRDALPGAPDELTRLVADIQLFAVHVQEAASRLLGGDEIGLAQALTPREIECLRWTMEGKTAWEVGSILGITERTAVLHVNNAAHKLHCTSKHQAVIKAMRMGLIH